MLRASSFPGGSVAKNPSANSGDARDAGLIWMQVGKIPWSRKWQPAPVFFFFFLIWLINVFNFWLCWVFIAACAFSVVAEGGGYSLAAVRGCSSRWLLWFWSMDCRCMGFGSCGFRALEHRLSIGVHGLRCFVVCGIFPGQGPNPCLLCGQLDPSPLSH